MQNDQSNAIREALSRAIKNASDSSLKAAAEQLEASNASNDAGSQFPPSGPFVRSTW